MANAWILHEGKLKEVDLFDSSNVPALSMETDNINPESEFVELPEAPALYIGKESFKKSLRDENVHGDIYCFTSGYYLLEASKLMIMTDYVNFSGNSSHPPIDFYYGYKSALNILVLSKFGKVSIIIVVGRSFIDIDDIYCFGTGLPILMSKDVYEFCYFK